VKSAKLNPVKKADIAVMRAMGYPTTEIAEKLGISHQLVSYYLNQFRKRAEKVGVHWAFLEVILQAGPAYPLFSVLSKVSKVRR